MSSAVFGLHEGLWVVITVLDPLPDVVLQGDDAGVDSEADELVGEQTEPCACREPRHRL
jgi:hypothetical protein